MQFSFKINNSDVDLVAIKEQWPKFIQNSDKPLFTASGGNWEIVSWSTDINKWHGAKASAIEVEYEEY